MAVKGPVDYDRLRADFADRLGGHMLEATERGGQLHVRVAADRRPDALTAAKELGLTFYVFCGGIDWPDDNRFEVLDQVYDITNRLRVTLRYDVPRDEPRIPSGAGVYRGADWYERETWELFGIIFAGHPRMARLFLSDWIEGYPLRKDFVLDARVQKPWPGAAFEG